MLDGDVMRVLQGWTHRLPLLYRFLLLEVGIFLLVFVGILFFAARYADQLRDRIDHERLLVTRAFASQTDDWLTGAYDQLGLAADELALAASPADAESALRRRPFLFDRGVLIVDREGHVVTALPEYLRAGPVDLPLDPGAIGGEARRVALAFKPHPDQNAQIALALRLPDVNADRLGVPGGYVVGLVDTVGSSLAGVLTHAMAVGETGHAEVVDQAGIAMLSSEPAHVLRGSDHPTFYRRMLASTLADAIEQVPYEDEFEPGEREDHVMGFVRLGAVPWGFSLGGSASETYAPIRTLWVTLYGLAGVLGVFALTVTVVGVEQLVRPVRDISDAARRVAGGEVDSPIHVTNGGEIGELGMSVERMRDSLYRWGRELDHRVSERTATLERRNRELAASASVAQAVASTLDPGDLAEAATTRIEQSLGVEGAVIALRARPGRPAQRRLGPGARRLLGQLPDSACEGCVLAEVAHAPVALTAVDGRSAAGGEDAGLALAPGSSCLTAALRAGGCHVVRAPIRSVDGAEGVLCVFDCAAPVPDADRRVVELLASEVALGLHNAMLYVNLRQREADRQALLAKVLSAQEDERRRLARELHDGVAQALIGATFQLDGLLALPAGRYGESRARLEQMRTLSGETLNELRTMILALRPPALDDIGLIAAIERYADRVRASSGTAVTIDDQLGGARLIPDAEVTVFRIVQEALNNVVRHSAASSATVCLRLHDGLLRVSVQDDGRGFAATERSRPLGGVGIEGMTERAELLGGSLRVDSTPGRGTTVRLEVAESLVLVRGSHGVAT